MSTLMHVSFQLKKTKIDEQGKVPIYARIIVDGVRTEFSIKRSVEPNKWISSAGIVKGRDEECKNLNAYLTTVRLKLNDKYRFLLEGDKLITPEAIKNAYLGISEKGKTLVEVMEYHNDQMKELINQEFAKGTHGRYCTTLKHIKEFLKWKYKVEDVLLKQVSHGFVADFEFYLKSKRKCCHNSAMKYVTGLKKVIGICLVNKWITDDPFANYKTTRKEVEIECLTSEEVQRIADKEFATTRLEQVRDIFLMCCFTGLCYADVQKLSKEHLIVGIDGNQWIKISRTKTKTRASVPLLPTAAVIISKYAKDMRCKASNKLLPVLSNQKMNSYLKEIAAVCGINKKITFHLARHTFATTITLANGVPIESVSKMLGHRSLKTTQHYAKVIDRKVSDDMELLKQKFVTTLNNVNQPQQYIKAC